MKPFPNHRPIFVTVLVCVALAAPAAAQKSVPQGLQNTAPNEAEKDEGQQKPQAQPPVFERIDQKEAPSKIREFRLKKEEALYLDRDRALAFHSGRAAWLLVDLKKKKELRAFPATGIDFLEDEKRTVVLRDRFGKEFELGRILQIDGNARVLNLLPVAFDLDVPPIQPHPQVDLPFDSIRPVIREFRASATGVRGSGACDPQRFLRGDDPNDPVNVLLRWEIEGGARLIEIVPILADGREGHYVYRRVPRSGEEGLPAEELAKSTSVRGPFGTVEFELRVTNPRGFTASVRDEERIHVPVSIDLTGAIEETVTGSRRNRLTAPIRVLPRSLLWAVETVGLRTLPGDPNPFLWRARIESDRLVTNQVAHTRSTWESRTDRSELEFLYILHDPCGARRETSGGRHPVEYAH